MRDYVEQVKELRDFAEEFNLEDYTETAIMLANAADAIEELLITTSAQKETIEVLRARNSAQADMLDGEWASVEEQLPDYPFGCLLVVWDSPPMGGDDFLNLLPYFAGWDGERWNDADGEQVPFEVTHWMPLPEPPKEVTSDA